VGMLRSAREEVRGDLDLAASMVQGVMAGVSRRLLESGDPLGQYEVLRGELIFLVCAYLRACSGRE
jgi:hypothetical protein